MATSVQQFDNLTVTIEDEGDSVREGADGSIITDSPDGGVVVQLFPNGRPARESDRDDDPAAFYDNIADEIGESELAVIGEQLWEAVQADDQSRSEWLSNRADMMDLLGLQIQDPTSGDGASAVDGQSVVTNPLMLEAVLKGWANAQAELLPAEGPCKIANYDPDEGEDELAEAYQRDFNYYLTSVLSDYVPDTQHMLLWGTYFGGSGFKKVYTDPIKKRPRSIQVQPEHLIVSDATKDLAACERITHVITMRQSEMKRFMAKGIYRQIALTPPNPEANTVDETIASMQGVSLRRDRPEDQPFTLWEIQCLLHLPGFMPKQWSDTDVPMPFLVTIDKDTHAVLAVRRDWKPEDEECERKRMYVKYPYVPGPGFYGTGLAQILGNSTAAMTAAWREALDAGMYANFPAGLIDKLGGRQNTVDMRISPGTLTGVETGGRSIKDIVAELPYKDVTPGLMTLIDKITEQSKGAAGAPDLPVGEGTANIPVGTMLAHIENTTKVMAAAHKGQHKAMDEELELIADLFRENPEAFWKSLKGKTKTARDYWDEQRLMQALNNYGLVPRSDPNVPSHIHRVMKAVALAELAGTELGKATLDPQWVIRRVLNALREDTSGIKKPDPNAPPSPEMITAQAKAKEADNKAAATQADLETAKMKLPVEQMKAQATLKGKEIDLARTLAANEDERKQADADLMIATGEHAIKARDSASEHQKRVHDAFVDRGKLQIEAQKVGLAHREADIAERGQQQQAGLAHAQLQHQKSVDTMKAITDHAKVGVAGHQAETQRSSAEAGAATSAYDSETKRKAAQQKPRLIKGKKKAKKK